MPKVCHAFRQGHNRSETNWFVHIPLVARDQGRARCLLNSLDKNLRMVKTMTMKYLSISEAKAQLLALLRESDASFERYCITRNGEPKGILMSVDDYDGWLETLEILSSKSALAEIRKARRELDAGKGIPFHKVLEKVRG